MPVQKSINSNIKISARAEYVVGESKPDVSYYFFSYTVNIHNLGPVPVQLVSRHWVITDGMGRVEEVRGPGVVGLQPRISKGKSFSYESACPLTTPTGSMRGFYQLLTDDGTQFEVEVPEFFLICPQALH
jgi:ApaG protein